MYIYDTLDDIQVRDSEQLFPKCVLKTADSTACSVKTFFHDQRNLGNTTYYI